MISTIEACRRAVYVAAGVAIVGAARADEAPSTVNGTVIALDADDHVVVDIAASRGAHEGDVVELWRPVKLRHPVTGRPFHDRFLVGELTLTQVRPTLSLAEPAGPLDRPPAAGDVVILRRAAPTPQAPVPERPARPSATPSGPDTTSPAGPRPAARDARPGDEAEALARLVESLAGSTPERRAARYEDFARAHPKGRFAPALAEEARALRQAPDRPPRSHAPRALSFDAPGEVPAGAPLAIAVELEGAGGAVLYARPRGAVGFSPYPMTAMGNGYFTTTLAPSVLTAPAVEYFIDAITADGSPSSVVGAASAPRHFAVRPAPGAPASAPSLTSLTLLSDYALYNTKRANDRVWQTEGAVGERFGDQGLRALRQGFGVYRGVGGSLHDLDDLGLAGRPVGLTYGYVELEFGLSTTLGVIGRGVIGLGDAGVSGGGQGFVRIGNDRRTNLLLGAEFLGGVGARGIAELDWNTLPRVPIVLRTEVTNQPAGAAVAPTGGASGATGDVGVRAIGQVGYRFTPSLTLAVRGSYQGRTINHAGPGFGAAVAYEW